MKGIKNWSFAIWILCFVPYVLVMLNPQWADSLLFWILIATCVGSAAFIIHISILGYRIIKGPSRLKFLGNLLTTFVIASLFVAFLIASIASMPDANINQGRSTFQNKTLESQSVDTNEIVRSINSQRRIEGLPALSENVLLDESAQAKAQAMVDEDYWDHVSPSGQQPWYYFNLVGYNYRHAGENLGRDFQTTDQLITAWMESESHRENILSSKYDEIGIGYVVDTSKYFPSTIIVTHFGSEPSDDEIANREQERESMAQSNPSRSGQIIEYPEWCNNNEVILIYENELITKQDKFGDTFTMTEGDWECYEKTY